MMPRHLVGRAEEPAPRAASKEAASVRAGKTTVTVIDENESVDDIVSRVRAARTQERNTSNPRVRTAADPRTRERVREAKATRPARLEPRPRDRIRDRVPERNAKPPRLQQRIERLRSR
jgi:hypothetical protein